MRYVKRVITNLIELDENGQTLVEYSLIIALIALVAIPAVLLMSGGLGGLYDTILAAADAMAKAVAGS